MLLASCQVDANTALFKNQFQITANSFKEAKKCIARTEVSILTCLPRLKEMLEEEVNPTTQPKVSLAA